VSLATVFLQHLDERSRGRADAAALEERLGASIAEAALAWPGFDLPAERFVRALALLVAEEEDLLAALAGLRASDLYLAQACAEGVPAALAALEQLLVRQAAAVLGYAGDAAACDEMVQALRIKLLVAEGDGLPRIARYGGRGPLEGWLHVIAVRALIDLRRTQPRLAPLEQEPAQWLSGAATDPEIAALRRQYKDEFRQAFGEVLAGLSSREGAVLRLYFLQGATAETLAGMYRVSVRTVRRWLAEVRERVFDATYAKLVERLRLSSSQVASLLTILETDLDMDIAASLGGGRTTPPDSAGS
jgi:RNA polymerase sigma-70 factor (ECF subfamily)